jgi:hypothetical protein
MTVNLEINTCKDCPNLGTERYYTSDSWEHVVTWYCKKTDRPHPEHSTHPAVLEVPDSSRIGWEEDCKQPQEIPAWCPLRASSVDPS